jgi:hypothetical protein
MSPRRRRRRDRTTGGPRGRSRRSSRGGQKRACSRARVVSAMRNANATSGVGARARAQWRAPRSVSRQYWDERAQNQGS